MAHDAYGGNVRDARAQFKFSCRIYNVVLSAFFSIIHFRYNPYMTLYNCKKPFFVSAASSGSRLWGCQT